MKKKEKNICNRSMGVVYWLQLRARLPETNNTNERQTPHVMTSTQYRHENVREESNIWPSPYTVGWFRWSNVCGEGEAPSFEDAVREAEEALIGSTMLDIFDECADQVEVVRDADFSTFEGRECIQVRLWRGFDLTDVSGEVHGLEIVLEGSDEYGRVYTLAKRTPARELMATVAKAMFQAEADGLFYIDDTPHTLEQLVDKLSK